MAFFHKITALDRFYAGLSCFTLLCSIIGYVSPFWIQRYQSIVPMSALGLWGLNIDSNDKKGFHFESDHVSDRTWRGWYFYYQIDFYQVWRGFNTDYFITIQFLATVGLIFELASILVLAYYYLAPSQSRSAKLKSASVLEVNRVAGGSTAAGPKSTSTINGSRGISKSTNSVLNETGGRSAKPSSVFSGKTKSMASMGNLATGKSMRSLYDKSKSMMSVNDLDYKPKTPKELVKRRLKIYFASAIVMLFGGILGFIGSIMFGSLHTRAWLSGTLDRWRYNGYYSWGFGFFILGSLFGMITGSLGLIHIWRLNLRYVTNPTRRQRREREMSVMNASSELLSRKEDVENDDDDDDDVPEIRTLSDNGVNESGKSDSGSGEPDGAGKESVKKSVSSSLRPLTGSLDSKRKHRIN